MLILAGVAFMVMGAAPSQIAWQPIVVGIGCFFFPYIASLVTGVLEAGLSLIGEFKTEQKSIQAKKSGADYLGLL